MEVSAGDLLCHRADTCLTLIKDFAHESPPSPSVASHVRDM